MQPCRIVIVEDEAIVAIDIEERLAAMGYELAGRADSGEQALEVVEQQRPDLILMDIRLQGAMDGIACAEEIRRRFHLPVIFLTAYFPAMERTQLPESVESAPLLRGRERLLVVDDEPSLASATKQMLEHLGYEVDCRTDVMEALEVFCRQTGATPFDLVITDMTMPRLTGVDLSRELLKLQANLPIILYTGFNEKINTETARSLGIRGVLMKPVAVRELAELIRKVLGERNTSAKAI